MRYFCILAFAATVLFGGLAVIHHEEQLRKSNISTPSNPEAAPVTVSASEGARILIH